MNLCSVFGISICILASSFAQTQSPQCNQTTPQIKSMKPNFGASNAFYDIAKGISDGLQNTPNSKTYDDLNDLIFGNGAVSYNQVIQDMVINQIGAIIFWSVGFVFVLAALVFGVATCIWQICFSCVPKETSTRSEITGYVYAGLLVTVFAFTLTGLIIFNVAETDLTDSIDNGMVYINQTASDLNTVINDGTDQVTCEVTTTTTQTFGNVNLFISNYSAIVVGGTATEVGLTAVNAFEYRNFQIQNNATIDAANILLTSMDNINTNGDACTTDKSVLQQQIEIMIPTLNALSSGAQTVHTSPEIIALNDQIDLLKKNIQTQADSASGSINSTQGTINDAMTSIRNMLGNVQNDLNNVMNSLASAHRDVVTSSAYSGLKIGIRLLITIPACIGCLFCILAFVAVVLSLLKKENVEFLATAVLVAFYLTILISIVLILFSSAAFVLGWLTSAACVPIFEDNNYTLFRLMNQTIAPVGTGSPDTVNIGQLLQSCNNPSMTLYTAVDGQTIISADSINQQINLASYRDAANNEIMSQPNSTYTIDNSYLTDSNSLNQIVNAANEANLSVCGNDDATAKYKDYIQKLAVSDALSNQFITNLQTLAANAPNTTSIAKNQNNNYFNQGDLSINQSISDLIINLQTNVFMCRPFVDVYNNGGFVMCEQFGKPIQGLWAAVGLTGLFLFFQSILLLLVYRWLRTNSDDLAMYNYRDKNDSTSKYSGTRKLGGKKDQVRPTEELWATPILSSTSNTETRQLPRVRPYDMDIVQPSEYDYSYGTGSQSHYPRVQVLPDERHQPMSPNYYDTQQYGTRTRFNDIDLFDHQSNNGSTARGLRRL